MLCSSEIHQLCCFACRTSKPYLSVCTSQSGGEQEVRPILLDDVLCYLLQGGPSPQQSDVMEKLWVKRGSHSIALLSLQGHAVNPPSPKLPAKQGKR